MPNLTIPFSARSDKQNRLTKSIGAEIMDLLRRQFITLAANAAAWSAIPSIAGTIAYPVRPVRVIVPFAVGGPADALARLVAKRLSTSFGKQFYVENQPGAGGNIGMASGARATPDGYTIIVVGTSYVVNPSLYGKIPYDPYKDFAPVTLAAISPNVLVVHPSLPANSVGELIAFLRANPGKYSFAHSGVGTTPQLSGEMFKQSQGLDIVAVPFGGSAPAIQSTVAGHTPIAFTVLTPALPQVKDGTLRALAVTTAKRSPALPNVPTLAEAGLVNQEADTILGILVPAKTPREIIELLYVGVRDAMLGADMRESLATLGLEPVVDTPDEFSIRIRADIAKWSKVIETAHIKAD
jgi:tripartite-type tricarboxylate transporter receptor subunit TctC